MGSSLLLICLLKPSRNRWLTDLSHQNVSYNVTKLRNGAEANLRILKISNSGLQSRSFTNLTPNKLLNLRNSSLGSCPTLGRSLLVPENSLSGVVISRGKKSKRKSEPKKTDLESSDDEEDDDDWKEEAGRDFKDMRAMVPSLRLDSILKAGLGISRNKLDNAFYESKIRVNEKKVLKKSKQLEEGDEIDIIEGPSSANPDLINVARVIILKVGQYSDDSDKLPVKLRRFKTLLIRKYNNNVKDDEE